MSVVMENCANGCGTEMAGCNGVKCVQNFCDNAILKVEMTDHIINLHSNDKLENGHPAANSLPPSADIEASGLVETFSNSSITATNGISDETNTQQVIQTAFKSSTDLNVENISRSSEADCNNQQHLETNGQCNMSEHRKSGSIESTSVKDEPTSNFPANKDERVCSKVKSTSPAEEHSAWLVLSAIASKHNSDRIENANDDSELPKPSPVLERRQSLRLTSSSNSVLSIQPSTSSVVSIHPNLSTLQQPPKVTLSAPTSASLPADWPMRISRSNENQPANRELIRPVAKLLQDTGLLLASEQVFKNLVKLQRNKVKRSKTAATAADCRLLEKLKSSHSTLACRNQDFAIESLKRCYCGFQSESSNVLCLHQQSGEWGPGKCCICDGKFAYRTWVQFERHVNSVHKQIVRCPGRPATYSCNLCPTDLGSMSLMKLHENVCRKRFFLARNLFPQVNHEDIPLKPRVLKQVEALSNSDVKIVVKLPDKKQTSVVLGNRPPANSSGGVVLIKPTVKIPTVSKKNIILSTNRQNTQTSVKVRATSNKQVSNADGRLPSVKTEGISSAVSKAASTSDERTKKAIAGCVICPACSGFVRDEAALEIHMRVVHSLLSSIEMTVCWMCHDRTPIAAHQLLSHLAERHGVTMASMLLLRQCSLCSTVPKMRNANAFEAHMLSTHSNLFVSAEALWQIIELLTPRCHNIHLQPDGTLQCLLCTSNFISRGFLCRHAFMAHGGAACNCPECHRTAADLSKNSKSASAVVISDEDDDIKTPKKIKLDKESELSSALPIEQEKARSIKCEQRFQDLIAQGGSLMDKVEEILEIDGETVLIVQEADYDEDDDDDN